MQSVQGTGKVLQVKATFAKQKAAEPLECPAWVMDRDGKIMKKKTLDCQPSLVMDFLRPWGKDNTVGVESTYNWYWLIDTLNKYEIPC